jgi:hypothetical protein
MNDGYQVAMAAPSIARRTVQRPLTRLGTAGMAGHVFFELAAGVGMPLASVLGPAPAAAVWATGAVTAIRLTGRGSCIEARHYPTCAQSPSEERLSGLVNGLAVGAVLAHLSPWPERPAAGGGIPWLAGCEGLGRDLLPAYNMTLYATGVTALGGLLRESGHGRPLGLLMAVAVVPGFSVGRRWEFRRLRAQAQSRPAWWNRRLRNPRT